MPITLRKSHERFHSNHGWLNSYHTFSFAGHYDARFDGYRCLRVINEDKVAPSEGFPKHGHRDFEIFSYVIRGELEHQDSMGNLEVIKRGGVQFTSAGRGIQHSEYNHSKTDDVHFLQIWVKPTQTGLTPQYDMRNFSDAEKRGRLKLLLSPDGRDSSIRVHNDILVFASLLDPSASVSHTLGSSRYAYVHVAQGTGSVVVNGTELGPGDGAFIDRESKLTITSRGPGTAEFLLFDMA